MTVIFLVLCLAFAGAFVLSSLRFMLLFDACLVRFLRDRPKEWRGRGSPNGYFTWPSGVFRFHASARTALLILWVVGTPPWANRDAALAAKFVSIRIWLATAALAFVLFEASVVGFFWNI